MNLEDLQMFQQQPDKPELIAGTKSVALVVMNESRFER
jgi:hypothetical protein